MIGYTLPEVRRLLVSLIQRHAPDPRTRLGLVTLATTMPVPGRAMPLLAARIRIRLSAVGKGVHRSWSSGPGATAINIQSVIRALHGHTLIDRELHLPPSWADDRNRRRAAGIPVQVAFVTEPTRAITVGVPFAWGHRG